MRTNHHELAEFRRSLDNLDHALLLLLAERFKITHQIGQYKQYHNLPSIDTEREDQQMARIRTLAEAVQLDPTFAERLLRFIIDEVVANHQRQRVAG
jgi:chorismate mutase